MRSEGELETHRVAEQLIEIDLVALDRVGLTLQRLRLEELTDVELQGTGDRSQAGTALALPPALDRAPDDDAVRDPFQTDVELDGPKRERICRVEPFDLLGQRDAT